MRSFKLKFKDTISLPVEMALVHKWGFRIEERNKNANPPYVMFAKDIAPIFGDAESPDGLAEAVKTDLIRRMNKIVDWYENPELHTKSIQARINNLAMCRAGAERQFVLAWSAANVTEDQ